MPLVSLQEGQRWAMRVLERHVEHPVVDWARRHGIIQVKFEVPGQTGWPDRLFFIPGGRPLFIEFKRPGEVLEPKQIYYYHLLLSLDYHIEVHDNAKSAIQAIIKAVEAARLYEKGK